MNYFLIKNKGFTFIDVTISVVIMGILGIIIFAAYNKFIKEAMISEGKMLASSVVKVERLYHAQAGDYKQTLDVSYNQIPEIEAQHNKYFKNFSIYVPGFYADSVFTVVTKSKLNILSGVEVVLHSFSDRPNMIIINGLNLTDIKN